MKLLLVFAASLLLAIWGGIRLLASLDWDSEREQ